MERITHHNSLLIPFVKSRGISDAERWINDLISAVSYLIFPLTNTYLIHVKYLRHSIEDNGYSQIQTANKREGSNCRKFFRHSIHIL